MKLTSALILLSLVAAAVAQHRLIWEDNFDWLDESKWGHLVTAWRGGNDEFQYYRNNRKNSYVENGVLKIKPTPVIEELSDSDIRYGYIRDPMCNMEPCTSQSGNGESTAVLFSARMNTQNKFTVTYGRVEIRAKMPRGDWLWPALWMFPNNDAYGPWPTSGENDIMETRGNRDLRQYSGGPSVGINVMGSTAQWGPDQAHNALYRTHWEKTLENGDFSDDFHIYEMEWTPNHILYRLDGQEVGSVYPPPGGFWELGEFAQNPGGNNPWAGGSLMAPFDKPFYIILNVAVGGRFFADSFVNGGYPRPWQWESGHPMLQFYEATWQWQPTWDRPAMEVDYIRVWEI